ncbi:sensor histidine kinase [Terriglobus aquaticus]|uniref:histidine kinase n=1 Tax=Terriglobus aquaticus TaxID=940139 RepID=A0ABW9KGZ2_9BACT|nr:PAS domain-containing sensor histidine kinase [Terriglobus aquaticus]
MQIQYRDPSLPERRRSTDTWAYHFAAIIQSAEIAIVSKDLDGIVTSWNPAAEQIFGYTAQEMIGQSIRRVFPPDRLWEEDLILSKVRNGQHVHHYESQRVTKSGMAITVALTISPISDASGKIIGASKIARDVSEEREFRRAVERAKDQFISNVSHELRTPLTSIKAALKLLEMGGSRNDDPRSAALFRIANDNAERLLRLVDDLLDFQRLEAKTTIDLRTCRITEVVRPAVESVSALGELRSVELLCDMAEVSDDTAVMADPTRLQQVLLNLLANALKHSPRESKIQIKVAPEGNDLSIRVIDEGSGIPEDQLERIFERFEQVDKTDARHEGGVGLGLAISRNIVEQHGGRIWAERNDAKKPGAPGSTFTLILPCAAVL